MTSWFSQNLYGASAESFYSEYMNDTGRPMQGRIAFVGLPNAGKKTLLNSLWGWEAVAESSETTRSFGLFTLMDLQSDPYEVSGTLYRLENADLIVFLLSAKEGLTQECFNWFTRLRSTNATLLVVLTRADLIPKDKYSAYLKLLETRLARPVLALAAQDKDEVREKLIPALLHSTSGLAVSLANEIPALRQQVARYTVLQSVSACLTSSLTPDVVGTSETVTGIQSRMLQQIAAVYGYKGRQNFRERLGVSLVMRWVMRSELLQLEWLRPGMIGAGLTVLMGYGAILGYGGYLPLWMYRFIPQVRGFSNAAAHRKSQ